MNDDRKKCLDAGCDDFLTKPIDRHHLLDMVQRAGRRSSLSGLMESRPESAVDTDSLRTILDVVVQKAERLLSQYRDGAYEGLRILVQELQTVVPHLDTPDLARTIHTLQNDLEMGKDTESIASQVRRLTDLCSPAARQS